MWEPAVEGALESAMWPKGWETDFVAAVSCDIAHDTAVDEAEWSL